MESNSIKITNFVLHFVSSFRFSFGWFVCTWMCESGNVPCTLVERRRNRKATDIPFHPTHTHKHIHTKWRIHTIFEIVPNQRPETESCLFLSKFLLFIHRIILTSSLKNTTTTTTKLYIRRRKVNKYTKKNDEAKQTRK